MDEMISRIGSSSSTTRMRSVAIGNALNSFAGGILNLNHGYWKYNDQIHKQQVPKVIYDIRDPEIPISPRTNW
jgi:hypothetical protein